MLCKIESSRGDLTEISRLKAHRPMDEIKTIVEDLERRDGVTAVQPDISPPLLEMRENPGRAGMVRHKLGGRVFSNALAGSANK